MTTPNDPSGEDSLIARYFKPLATDPGAFALVDDAAVLSSSGDDIVVTTDAVVEGVHYLATDPPDTIARKALRVNLSDLAAKGASPAGFVLTLALRSKEDAWLRPFADALGEDVKTFACPLLGGDTVSTPGPQMISITAFGRVPTGADGWPHRSATGRYHPGDGHDRRCRARAGRAHRRPGRHRARVRSRSKRSSRFALSDPPAPQCVGAGCA
ncbi:thiamine monophosphate kinase [Bradyrhizobium sp. USDA 4472]